MGFLKESTMVKWTQFMSSKYPSGFAALVLRLNFLDHVNWELHGTLTEWSVYCKNLCHSIAGSHVSEQLQSLYTVGATHRQRSRRWLDLTYVRFLFSRWLCVRPLCIRSTWRSCLSASCTSPRGWTWKGRTLSPRRSTTWSFLSILRATASGSVWARTTSGWVSRIRPYKGVNRRFQCGLMVKIYHWCDSGKCYISGNQMMINSKLIQGAATACQLPVCVVCKIKVKNRRRLLKKSMSPV